MYKDEIFPPTVSVNLYCVLMLSYSYLKSWRSPLASLILSSHKNGLISVTKMFSLRDILTYFYIILEG